MRIVIRADAGMVPEIGTGHIVRDIVLAEALCKTNIFKDSEVLFATRKNPPYNLGANLIEKSNFKIIENLELDPNTQGELASLLNTKPDLVILDRLATEIDLVKNLHRAGIFVVTFDDLGPGQLYADLAIHALLQNVELRENVFIGYEYLILASPVVQKKVIKKNVSNIFISFGGFDHRNLNDRMLRLISNINGPKHYDIIVSGLDSDCFKRLTHLSAITESTHGVKIDLHNRPNNYHEILSSSDLAIVSGGLTAFECARAGIPAIGIPQYEHQLENLNRLQKIGCLRMISRTMLFNDDIFCDVFSELILNYDDRRNMSEIGMATIDSKGLDRTVDLIETEYLKKIARSLS